MRQRISLVQGRGDPRVEVLLVNLAQKHLDDFDRYWRPLLQQLEAEDKFWDWVVKKRISISSGNFESYALEFEGRTQGLMVIETQWHRSQVDLATVLYPWKRLLLLRGIGV